MLDCLLSYISSSVPQVSLASAEYLTVHPCRALTWVAMPVMRTHCQIIFAQLCIFAATQTYAITHTNCVNSMYFLYFNFSLVFNCMLDKKTVSFKRIFHYEIRQFLASFGKTLCAISKGAEHSARLFLLINKEWEAWKFTPPIGRRFQISSLNYVRHCELGSIYCTSCDFKGAIKD